MATKSISSVRDSGLCTSCGICSAVCPYGAITFGEVCGTWVPTVSEACVSCGRCLAVCPGKGDGTGYSDGSFEQVAAGDAKMVLSACSTNSPIVDNAVSGGVVTQLIGSLLDQGAYDCAFVVRDVCIGLQTKSVRVTRTSDLSPTQKSRYLQVSHEETLRHMLAHRDERVIIVAVPCALRGLLAAIDLCRLDRERYLLIGLFCDKTMTGNVLRYFESFLGGRKLERADFRTKAIDGWPGDVRLVDTHGDELDLNRSTRMAVKEYFQPECCLYCLDKLNRMADIAVGDDYVNGAAANDGRGACTAVIRTERGLRAWNACASCMRSMPQQMSDVIVSQHLGERQVNLHYARLKQRDATYLLPDPLVPASAQDTDHPWLTRRNYEARLRKIRIGREYARAPMLLERALKRKDSPSARLLRMAARLVARIVKG